MLPPNARGTGEPHRPQSGGGAVAMIPKNGSSGISLPQGIMQTLRCRSILGWMVFIVSEFVRQRAQQRQYRCKPPVLSHLHVENEARYIVSPSPPWWLANDDPTEPSFRIGFGEESCPQMVLS